MKKDPKKKPKMGAPKKEFSWDDFYYLCSIQCTLEEIAGFFRIDEDTISARCKEEHGVTFSVLQKKHAAEGRQSLRRRLFQLALSDDKGAVTAAIWLSKQHLKMRDKPEEVTTELSPLVIKTSIGNIELGFSKPKRDDENEDTGSN